MCKPLPLWQAALILAAVLSSPAHGGLLKRGTVIRGQPNDIPLTYYYCLDFVAPPSGDVFVVFRSTHDFPTHRLDIVSGAAVCPSAPCDQALPAGSCTVSQNPPVPLPANQETYLHRDDLTPGSTYTARLVACDTIGFCGSVEISVYESTCP